MELKAKLNPVRFTSLLGMLCLSAGCSGANPLPRTPGEPTDVKILGVSYTVPARLDIPDFDQQPGRALMVFEDNITRCEGLVMIQSVGNAEAHDEFIDDATRNRETMFMEAGLSVNTETDPYSVWSEQGRLTSLLVTQGNESLRHSILDVHSNKRQLSLVSEIICQDPGLMDQEIKAIAAFADTAAFPDSAAFDDDDAASEAEQAPEAEDSPKVVPDETLAIEE